MKSIPYILMIAFTIAVMAFLWTPGEEENRVLENQGLSGVVIDTLSFWGCPDEQYGYKFTAINQAGKTVNGVMCKNGYFFGSWNVRYF
ncbi:hypothetical protein SUREIYA_01490 [Serratia phage vB_SmaM-Sureiya]|nr:hypothetical protein SUREIYA_01490 [Serratia phage vB_SmaM-Sureiya]